MPTEGSEQSGMQGLGLPASTRARLAWRTPAMSAAESLFAGMPYSFSALARANQFLAWHDHLANRFHTVSGALPTPVEFDSELEGDGFPSVASFDLGLLGENLGLRVGLFGNISPLSPRGGVRAAPFRASPPLETRPGEGFERSTIEVEPLRRIDQATDGSTPARALNVPEAQPVEAEAAAADVVQPAWQAAPETVMPNLPLWLVPQFPDARAESQPRLKLSVSFVPRREVSDFYRHAEAPVVGTVITETEGAKEIPQAEANAIGTPGWEAARQAIASAAVQMLRPGSPRRDEAATVKPADQRDGIPIFASPLRVMTQSEVKARNHRRIEEEKEKAGRNNSAAPPPPPAAPPLDINAVAEKVSDILARRQQFERERKG